MQLDTRDSDQAHLRLGVRGIQTASPDRYAMQLLTAVLGGGMSSRLFPEVRERLGLAYYVFLPPPVLHDTGTLFSQAGVDTERIDRPCRPSPASSARSPGAGPDDELRRCKNYLKGRLVLQLEDPRGLLMFGLRREVLENRLAEPEEVLRDRGGHRRRHPALARQVIVDDGLNFGLVGPFDDPQRFLDLLAA